MKKAYFNFLSLILVLVGCNKVDFDKGQNVNSVLPIATVCDGLNVQSASVDIGFASNQNAPGTMCAWDRDSGGRQIIEAKVIMARNEETRSFNIPAGAILCSFQVVSPAQNFEYDDMFLLTLNGIVLTSATSFFSGFDKWQGMDQYSWNKLNRVEWPFEYNENAWIYCLGGAEGRSNCQVPKSQTVGPFNLNIDSNYIADIGTRSSGSQELRLIVTGDNEPDIDCKHSALNFTVNLKYAMP